MARAFNNTHYDGCDCPNGNPQCGFCTDTFVCDMCDDRHYTEGSVEAENMFICQSCAEELELEGE